MRKTLVFREDEAERVKGVSLNVGIYFVRAPRLLLGKLFCSHPGVLASHTSV